MCMAQERKLRVVKVGDGSTDAAYPYVYHFHLVGRCRNSRTGWEQVGKANQLVTEYPVQGTQEYQLYLGKLHDVRVPTVEQLFLLVAQFLSCEISEVLEMSGKEYWDGEFGKWS